MVIRTSRRTTINAQAPFNVWKMAVPNRFGDLRHSLHTLRLPTHRTWMANLAVVMAEKFLFALRTNARAIKTTIQLVYHFFSFRRHAAFRLYMPSYVTGDLLTITAACAGRGVLSPSRQDKTVRGLTPKSAAAFWSSFIFSRYSIKSISSFYTKRVRSATTFLHESFGAIKSKTC